MYAYIFKSLGPNFGVLGGVSLVIAYIACGAACAPLFVNYLNVLLMPLGVVVPSLLTLSLIVLFAWFLAWKDICLSAKVMLYIELSSLAVGSILAVVVIFKLGINFDTSQFSISKFSTSGIMQGTILAFMCLVGFESASMLGDEAKNPLKNIPRAVILSTLIAGAYYIVNSYTYVSAFRFLGGKLSESKAPVTDVAAHFGISALAVLLTIGSLVSALAVVVASINAGARGLYLMAEHGILNEVVSNTHKKNKTPNIAVDIVSIIVFIVPAVLVSLKIGLGDIWGLVGSISTFGFLVVYLLIDIAGPVFLHGQNKLKFHNVIISILGGISVLIPFVGSVYPVPAFPNNLLIYIFTLLLAAGFIRFLWQRKKNPSIVSNIQEQIANKYDEFEEARKERLKSKDAKAV